MPIYLYRCQTCGAEEEQIQKFSDPHATRCDACGADALERIVAAAAFHLKGGGWYKDLYASKKPDASSSADAPKKASGEGAVSKDSGTKKPPAGKKAASE